MLSVYIYVRLYYQPTRIYAQNVGFHLCFTRSVQSTYIFQSSRSIRFYLYTDFPKAIDKVNRNPILKYFKLLNLRVTFFICNQMFFISY